MNTTGDSWGSFSIFNSVAVALPNEITVVCRELSEVVALWALKRSSRTMMWCKNNSDSIGVAVYSCTSQGGALGVATVNQGSLHNCVQAL